jgi:alpha-galactosidase
MRKPALFIATLLLIYHSSFGQNKNVLYESVPVFHGAQVMGNYPNTPFIFTVPATGERPITFSAQNLPVGLSLDASTGIITGNVTAPGEYKLKVTATNAKGKTEEDLKIVIGETLCLTPPMGWNSWNVFTKTLDEKMVMDMADAMVSTGMRDLGYAYIDMDDFWHADTRDSLGRPVPDAKKFPHGMKYLSNYVHSKGLKLGIYSCAGKMTCGHRFGGYTYEEIDAKTYAEWGIDLLKYDYCFAPPLTKDAFARYSKMGGALKHSGTKSRWTILARES